MECDPLSESYESMFIDIRNAAANPMEKCSEDMITAFTEFGDKTALASQNLTTLEQDQQYHADQRDVEDCNSCIHNEAQGER